MQFAAGRLALRHRSHFFRIISFDILDKKLYYRRVIRNIMANQLGIMVEQSEEDTYIFKDNIERKLIYGGKTNSMRKQCILT